MARPMKRILVTGAAGKVGSHFIAHILQSDQDVRIRALCHNRMLEPEERLEIVRGTISDRAAGALGHGRESPTFCIAPPARKLPMM